MMIVKGISCLQLNDDSEIPDIKKGFNNLILENSFTIFITIVKKMK